MEPQSKNLKSIFLNFLLLLALIFSVMGLYISLSFSEKVDSKAQEAMGTELITRVEDLSQTVALLEKTVLEQSNTVKALQKQLETVEREDKAIKIKAVKKDAVKLTENKAIKTRIYEIKSGDTFSKIAKNYGVSLNALMKANSNLNPRALKPGQEIVVPLNTQ